jgi:hypothetical protein
VTWRGGNRGNRFTGPGAPEGSRGARKDQITCVERGPGKAESRAPEEPWKVVNGCFPADSWSIPGKCKKAQIAIKSLLCFRKDKNGVSWAPWAYWGPNSFQAARDSWAPGIPRGSFTPNCSRVFSDCWVLKHYRVEWVSKAPRDPQIDSGQ